MALSTTALARSDDLKQIDHCVHSIGKSKQRLEVFEAIYKGQKQTKSVPDLMSSTQLLEKQVRAAVTHLADHHMCIAEGRGVDTRITKDAFCRKYRDSIIRGVKDPAYLDKLQSKRARKVSAIGPTTPAMPVRASNIRRRPSKNKKRLTIAFLTTNPERDLRTDVEFRAVAARCRESANRDSIDIQNVAAASIEDLLRVLNDMQPDIVHFSGHGNVGLVLFDGDSIEGEAVEVEFAVLRNALEATQTPPRLVVLNSCFGALQATDLLGEVEAVVGMNNSVDDTAAAIFARQFYGGLFGGQPIDKAMAQGVVVLRAAGFEDAEFPQLAQKEGVDVSKMKFF